MSILLEDILERSAARHSHLCPRQVLGARMALAALDVLEIARPITKQSGLVILETDGCFADGIEVASGASVGHRTLRIEDLGKVAGTFIDVERGRAIRLFPRADARLRSRLYAPKEDRRYEAMLRGYRAMPVSELFHIQDVVLTTPLEAILSTPGARVTCNRCGEEIINEREVRVDGVVLCRACAHGSYYRVAEPAGARPQAMGAGRQQRVRPSHDSPAAEAGSQPETRL